MKLHFLSLLSALFVGVLSANHAMAAVAYDTSDPMYLTSQNDLLFRTGISFSDSILRLSEKVSYGLNNRLSLSADLKYQLDFDGDENGFSNLGLEGIYRLSGTSEGGSSVISDALFGIKFGGSKRVREPEFADTVYFAGMRVGRQWNAMTLAGTVKTSWIFDENRGMAYIDLIPEAYFRMSDKWMSGFGFQFRKATNPHFDREWINAKLVRQYGRTQYNAQLAYEFEKEDWQINFDVNILF